jgi:hypothetical protein
MRSFQGDGGGAPCFSAHRFCGQKYAVEHELLRQYVVMPLGQGFHWLSVRGQRLLAGSTRKDVRPLTAEEAVADGSELLGEAFVFAVAAAVVTNEYIVSARKATAKAEELDRTLEALGATVSTLEQVRAWRRRSAF